MNIGFISTWFERGAAYVTKSYVQALEENNNVFVYARGGEELAKGNKDWDFPYVTWGLRLSGTRINYGHFKKWIINNNINTLFFNEQHEFEIVTRVKLDFPEVKIGSYIDYYKEDSVGKFNIYDFLICNTKRHHSVFEDHPQCYYVPWGTDVDLFKPKSVKERTKFITFYHSVGMSKRKGTDLVIRAFIEGNLYEQSNLLIHTQLNFEKTFGYSLDEIKDYNITVIEDTIPAPGIYHKGDVYLYPTRLDGLGLTIYEALSCGLPVITTNNAPMNEIVTHDIGYLIDIEKLYSRADGYYWPQADCNMNSLINGMKYYIQNSSDIHRFKSEARNFAVKNLNWEDRFLVVNKIFSDSRIISDSTIAAELLRNEKKRMNASLVISLIQIVPNYLEHMIRQFRKKR